MPTRKRGIPDGIPVVTIHEVHYYDGDAVAANVDVGDLVERGFLVPADGGETKVDNDG
jgi:hypothetical protein